MINKYSDRLQKLEPFLKWDGKDFEKLPVLAKIEENVQLIRFPCWCMVMYRVHLYRISDNLVLGAVNAYRNGKVGNGMNVLNDNIESYPHIAREYKNGSEMDILADKNYGDGSSSREHAAMSPRHLGCAAVIARSFARIHKPILTNKEC